MSTSAPPPPVPAACDLRRFSWIPLPVGFVGNPDWWLTASPAAQAAQHRLIAVAWHQVPASSLPNDDRLLAKYGLISAKVKRSLSEIKQEWVLCSDGRLYHPELAEIALDSLIKKQKNISKTAAAREALVRQKESVTDSVTDSTREDKTRKRKDTERENTGTGTRLPDDWWPSEAEQEYAIEHLLDPGRTAQDFRDHWHASASPSATKLEWEGAWRAWCRRDFNGTGIG